MKQLNFGIVAVFFTVAAQADDFSKGKADEAMGSMEGSQNVAAWLAQTSARLKDEPRNYELQNQLNSVLYELGTRLERTPRVARQQLTILRGGARDAIQNLSQTSAETPVARAVTLVDRCIDQEEKYVGYSERGQMRVGEFERTASLLQGTTLSSEARLGLLSGLREFGQIDSSSSARTLSREIFDVFVREGQSEDVRVSRSAIYELRRHLEGLAAHQSAEFDILGNVSKLMDHQVALSAKNKNASTAISPLADILLDLVKNGSRDTSALALQQLEQRLSSDALKGEDKLDILRAAGRVSQARSLVLSRLFHVDPKISAKALEIALENVSDRDPRSAQELFDMIQKRWATLSPEERMALMDQLVANLGSYSTNARVATIGIINSLLSGDFSPNEFASIQARLACHEKVDNVSTSLSGIEAILGILTVIDGLGRSGGLVPSGATYNGPRATVVMMKTTARLEAQEIARLQQDIRALYREKADGRIEATGPVSAGCVEQQAQVDPTAAPRSGVSPSRADRRPAIITGSGAR